MTRPYSGYDRALLRLWVCFLVGTAIGVALKHNALEFAERIAYLTLGTLLVPPASWLLDKVWTACARLFKRQRKRRYYDPKNVKITFNGVELTGFMDGTFVDLESNTGVQPDHVSHTVLGSKSPKDAP